MLSRLTQYLRRISARQCRLCQLEFQPSKDRREILCSVCYQSLPFTVDICRTCANPISQVDSVCGECLKSPPALEELLVPFHYHPPIKQWISQLKFKNASYLALWFAYEIEQQVKLKHTYLQWEQATIIPVPLHASRMRQRGYNQAQLIAQELAKNFKLPIHKTLIQRIKKTQEQTQLNAESRRRNLNNAFKLNTPPPKTVILIDDVVTTGSTVNEITGLLKANGCETVIVWAIAKAVLEFT